MVAFDSKGTRISPWFAIIKNDGHAAGKNPASCTASSLTVISGFFNSLSVSQVDNKKEYPPENRIGNR